MFSISKNKKDLLKNLYVSERGRKSPNPTNSP